MYCALSGGERLVFGTGPSCNIGVALRPSVINLWTLAPFPYCVILSSGRAWHSTLTIHSRACSSRLRSGVGKLDVISATSSDFGGEIPRPSVACTQLHVLFARPTSSKNPRRCGLQISERIQRQYIYVSTIGMVDYLHEKNTPVHFILLNA